MGNNVFLEDWKNTMLPRIKMCYPDLTDEQIMEVLNDDIARNFKDPDSTIHNDYNDDMLLRQPLSAIYRFAKEKKPILGGNGTLFYNQDAATSPVAGIIDGRIDARNSAKGKMKEIMHDMANVPNDTPQYASLKKDYEYFDSNQNEKKIRVNSIYGSFGATTFQLYNKYTAAATTGTAQSLISATGIGFEVFIDGNLNFKSLDDCLTYLHNIISEEYHVPFDGIDHRLYNPELIADNLMSKFSKNIVKPEWRRIILLVLMNCGHDNLVKIYYKNNLLEFVECPAVTDIMVKIFNKLESFNNPNKVPNEIRDDMSLLWEYFEEFVFYNHATTERINRLKNDERAVVKLIDTDSNIIYIQPWVDTINKAIIPKADIKMNEELTKFAAINVLAFLITAMITELLKTYCKSANILERYWPRINMKNEYCFAPLLLAPVKKRYVARIRLREGEMISKTEIKGHDFRKAAISEYVREYLENIIEKRILDVSPNVDIPGIMTDLSRLEEDIVTSLTNGERKYLIRLNCKDQVAYKNPYSMPQVLSVLAWNTIYPEQEIRLPDKLDVVLMKIPNVATLETIRESFPYEYDRIRRFLLEGSLETFRDKGVRYLALPNNIDGIPEFARPFIDFESVKLRNLNTFGPITEALGNTNVGTKQNSHFSNIRKTSRIEV